MYFEKFVNETLMKMTNYYFCRTILFDHIEKRRFKETLFRKFYEKILIILGIILYFLA